MRTTKSFALIAAVCVALGSASISLGEEPGNILGDDLKDLEKAVNSLPAPATKNPTTGPSVTTGGDGKPTWGGDTVVKRPPNSDGADKPPVVKRPPNSDGADKPPVVKRPPNSDGTDQTVVKNPVDPNVTVKTDSTAITPNIERNHWAIERGDEDASVTIKAGQLVLDVNQKGSAVNTTRREPLKGDFDLQIVYEMTGNEGAKQAALSGGLGVRMTATGSWDGDQQVSVDHTGDEKGDLILAAKSDQIDPVLEARPKTRGGALRVKRQGDQFQVSYHDEGASEWTSIGSVNAKLSPRIELWLTAYADAGDVRVTVKRVDVK